MTLSCSKMTLGSWKEAKNATCLLRMPVASSIKRLGKPSGNVFHRMLPSLTAGLRRATAAARGAASGAWKRMHSFREEAGKSLAWRLTERGTLAATP